VVDRRVVTRALRFGGDIFRSDALTVHQRPERPDLVGVRHSHLPLEQLIDRLSFREVEFLDLLSVGKRWRRRVLAAFGSRTPEASTLSQYILYPAIGDEPDYGDEGVDRNRQPGIKKSQRNSGGVKSK
jgi:hypothetical protein